MSFKHAVIFTGFPSGAMPLGAYRIRTESEKHGYQVQVVDYSWHLDMEKLAAICEKFITFETQIVGFSNNWIDGSWRLSAHEISDYLKLHYPNVKIVEGGQRPHKTTTKPKWWLKGFSDLSWIHLLNHIYKGTPAPTFTIDGHGTRIVHSDIAYAVSDYDSLGTLWHADDQIDSHQALPIEIGRGCIFQCAFCHHPFLGKKKGEYVRSVDSIADEFKRNYDMFGTTRYQFIDDTFNDSEEKIQRVVDARDKAGVDIEFVCYLRAEMLVTQPQTIPQLIDLGLRSAHIGLESLNMKGRKAIGKGMKVERVLDAVAKVRDVSNKNVSFWATLIAGVPGDTVDSIKEQAEWLYQHRETHIQAWWHYPLNINLQSTNLSDIEKNPSAYGYDMSEGNWKSAEMNFQQAVDVSNYINKEKYRNDMIASGYIRAYGWGCGMTDEELDRTPFLSIPFRDKFTGKADSYFANMLGR